MDDLISRQAAIDAAVDAADEWDGGYSRSREEIITKRLSALPSAQPVFSELCSTELTCEGCKWEKNGNDLCFECCRGCGDMYEERKDNG